MAPERQALNQRPPENEMSSLPALPSPAQPSAGLGLDAASSPLLPGPGLRGRGPRPGAVCPAPLFSLWAFSATTGPAPGGSHPAPQKASECASRGAYARGPPGRRWGADEDPGKSHFLALPWLPAPPPQNTRMKAL